LTGGPRWVKSFSMPVARSPCGRWSTAAAAAATVLLATGCAPSRWVAQRAPPPSEVAREAARAPAPAAAPVAPVPVPAPAAPPRSLADLVDLALSHDPATRAVWHDARAAAALAGSRRSLYLPSLDASAALTTQRMGSAPGRPSFEQSTYGASATITWLLLDLGARGALVDEADRLLVAARLAQHAAVADLVLTVQETYFGYLAARALVEAENASVRQAEASLAAAQGLQRAGLATIADVLQARTALSQRRLVLQQAEGQVLAVRGALATVAGLSPTAELEVGALPAEVDADAAHPAIDDLLAAAAARNPDVARARAAAEAADARARAASRARWPTLSLQTGASRSFYLEPADLSAATSWSAGLVLRLPLLEGIRPAYDALAARAGADAARARADATGQRVSLDVWLSFQALRTAGGRIATARDLLSSASASAEVAAGRYREGVGSIVDLLNAQAALELARAEDVRARADYLVAIARLARATGRLELHEEVDASPAAPGGSRSP
jgi:outer membrane protein